jgi:predicted RNase H-like nuclease (RuvC/YqgF family)
VTRLQEILSETTAKIEDLQRQLDQRMQANSRRHIDRQVPTDEELRSQLERKRRDEKQIRQTLNKAEDQKRVIGLGIDTSTLSYAIRKFENLQQLRLMPVTDALDAGVSIKSLFPCAPTAVPRAGEHV